MPLKCIYLSDAKTNLLQTPKSFIYSNIHNTNQLLNPQILMKTTNDKMGGFIAAEIIRVSDVRSFDVKDGRVNISFKSAILPNYLDIVKNGVEAGALCTTTKSGKLYNIDITIEVKEYICFSYTAFNKYLCILTLPTGDMHVFGTPQFPLTISSEPIYSKTPSGRAGGLYRLTGKQPNNVLIL